MTEVSRASKGSPRRVPDLGTSLTPQPDDKGGLSCARPQVVVGSVSRPPCRDDVPRGAGAGAPRGVQARLPPAILHRGAHAADRARGHFRFQPQSCAARGRGATSGEDLADRPVDYGSPDPARLAWWRAFQDRLRELGYVEGQNVVFQPRWGNGQVSRLQGLATELVAAKVDILVTAGNPCSARGQAGNKLYSHRDRDRS
mgnify:CR=1 FL=1